MIQQLQKNAISSEYIPRKKQGPAGATGLKDIKKKPLALH
jgi:hypothetical protein